MIVDKEEAIEKGKELMDEEFEDISEDEAEEILEEANVYERECAVCGETLYEFEGDKIPECDICGWTHFIVAEDGWKSMCVEPLTPELYWGFNGKGEGDIMCYSCREDFSYHPDGTLVISFPDGREDLKVIYRGDVGMPSPPYEIDWNRLSQATQAFVEGIITGTEWVKTDAWRGYNSTPDEADGWTRIIEGWHSTMTHTDASDFINDLPKFAEEYGIRIAKVFTTTSNICSTGVDIYIQKKDVETFKELYREHGTTSTGLDGGLKMLEA